MIHVIAKKRAFCDASVRPVSIQLLTLSPVIKVNLSRWSLYTQVLSSTQKEIQKAPPKAND